MLSKPQSWLPGRHVPVFPEREVTRAGVEDAPASAGLSRDDVEAMWRAVTRLYRTGLHPALALTVLRRGRTVTHSLP